MNSEFDTGSALRRVPDVIEEVVSILIIIVLLVYAWLVDHAVLQDVPLLLGSAIAILILIAISNLRDRLYRFRRIQDQVEKTHQAILKSAIYQVAGADEFFTGRDDSYGELLSTASSIAISGVTLSGTVQTYRATLRERLEAGARVRLLIIDPTSEEVLAQIVRRSWSSVATPDYYKGSLGFISELIENIGNIPNATGSLELGYLPFVPSFGVTLTDPEEKDGAGFVEIYHHLTDKSPGFQISPSTDPQTFQLYHEQFELLWKASNIRKIA